MKPSYALGLAMLLLAALPAVGQPMPRLVEQALLDAHNAVRVRVGSPPLVWSDALATDAARWANHLVATHTFVHQPNDPHGENLFLMAGGTATPLEVVRAWMAEMRDYDHNTNSCSGVCGHYTQVIWRSTRAVGCGMAFDGYRQVWVCEYEPPGNVIGLPPY
jgi:uncharacterized protein YkwD